ncbi:TetR/AcrR family transcriptional regulator [Staphylococcus arlettae]|uniref:TetR/AcrR family transcriptional regulator n=1 Tax=Staphylococcus arlettae TaxID=29378 RepID=UPI0011548436
MEIATELFSEHGYSKVSLEDIVETEQLTRGAVYHHFKSKKGLFYAVFEHAHQLIAEEISAVDEKNEDQLEQLIEGCRIFIETISKENMYRILLVDGPSVLGWQIFRRFDKENSMKLLQNQIEQLQDKDILQQNSSIVMTHALSGAINELSIWGSEQNDKKKAIEKSMVVIEGIILGFKNPY